MMTRHWFESEWALKTGKWCSVVEYFCIRRLIEKFNAFAEATCISETLVNRPHDEQVSFVSVAPHITLKRSIYRHDRLSYAVRYELLLEDGK